MTVRDPPEVKMALIRTVEAGVVEEDLVGGGLTEVAAEDSEGDLGEGEDTISGGEWLINILVHHKWRYGRILS